MKTKFFLLTAIFISISGCISYQSTALLNKNYRIVSLKEGNPIKADLMDVSDSSVYYNQELQASCKGLLKEGDYIPLMEVKSKLNGFESKHLEKMPDDDYCMRAPK